MTAPALRSQRGAIVWALVGFQPEAPFATIRASGERESYASAGEVAQAISGQMLAQAPSFVVRGKLRPVVLLQDRPRGVLPEFAALKLLRLSKLDSAAQERVRSGDRPGLFYLPVNARKYGLRQENAVDLNSLVRVHQSAIVTAPVGYLDTNEIDVLGRRLAEFLDIDLGPAIREGVIRRWEQLVAEQAPRGDG